MARAGRLNTICDVPGLSVGCAEDQRMTTGTTVIVPDAPAVAAVDHRGGGVGSRDTVLLGPGSAVETVHALCLSGGSAYGLDAGGGVMHGLRQDRQGFAIGAEIVPIVPTAIIFDLLLGGAQDWSLPPWWDLGLMAYRARCREVALGNAGAGLGATAGRLKGGQGSASWVTEAYTLGALAIANPVGDVVIPGTRTFWAWMHEVEGELGGQVPPTGPILPAAGGLAGGLADGPDPDPPLANTTLAVVATDAVLTKDQAQRVAIMAQDGLAMAIAPVHGPMDGDTVFVLSTGQRAFDATPASLSRLGSQAATCVARAIARGVYAAEGIGGYPALRSGATP